MAHLASILIADGNAETAATKAKFLSEKGYLTQTVTTPDTVIGRASLYTPDIVLLGSFDDSMSPYAIARSLRGNPATSLTPIALTEASPDSLDTEAALALSIDDVFTATADQTEFLARLPRLSRFSVLVGELERRLETAQDFGIDIDPMAFKRGYSETPEVMIIAKDEDRLASLSQGLSDLDLKCSGHTDAFKAADQLDGKRLDAVLITLGSDDDFARAQYVFGHIRSNPRLYNLPTLVLAENSETAKDISLYRSGAAIVLSEAASVPEMALYLKMLITRQRVRWTLRDPYKATLAAKTADSCKTAYSKEFWKSHLNSCISDAQARSSNLSIGLFSIPTLPRIREEFGEENAEILAHQLADWITGMTRIEDMVARIGPDSFAALFPDTPEEEASRVVQRIVGILHNSEFHLGEEVMQVIHAVVEAGTAKLEDGDSAEHLMARVQGNVF